MWLASRDWGRKCSWYNEAGTDLFVEGSCDSQFVPRFEAMREPLKTLELRERGGAHKTKL